MSPKSNTAPLPPLALTMGDPSGVAPDITLLAWQATHTTAHPFFIVGDANILTHRAKALGLSVPISTITHPSESTPLCKTALPVLHADCAVLDTCGLPCPANAPMVIQSIADCVNYVQSGDACAVVTNPINKSVLYSHGFAHHGHTEYLAHLTTGDESDAIMMLACTGDGTPSNPPLRVVPLTTHLSLRDAIAQITPPAVTEMILRLHHECQTKLGIPHPRIAIAGLNPHAGENGAMGAEDMMIIAPAIENARQINPHITVTDPLPADTLFHAHARTQYDIALCMYHDQALIPIKTLDFHGGVNVTLGLPIIRTSPDHGTAFGLAGTGQANPNSLINALSTAHTMATQQTAQ